MKPIFRAFFLIFFLCLFSMNGVVYGANITSPSDNHTVREEAEGKEIWEKLQAKQVECKNLTDDDFESLGEYFMGQMAESSHEVMNKMMVQMMGKSGEEQMHIMTGKRMSKCEPDAPMPQNMMNMMMGGTMGNFGTNPMAWFGLGWIFMILFWGLVLIGIIALIKWLVNQSKGGTKAKSALDILKERYAGGEIDKKEFEEKKKDLYGDKTSMSVMG